MKRFSVWNKFLTGFFATLLLMGVSACSDSNRPFVQGDERPNIVLIVADDLGFTDIGAYGGEINTPNLDTLSEESIRMTNFHVAPTCSLTRSMLMSGVSNIEAGVGTMYEARAFRTPAQAASDNYDGFLNDNVEAFSVKLKDAGYHTYMAGKWHLSNVADEDATKATCPEARGFENSFVLLDGGASHFTKRGADPTRPFAIYMDGSNFVEELPADFYSSKTYTDKLIEYIDANIDDGKPFFAYAAYTAPHWPLQVPDEWLDRYKGQYDSGYEVIRQERITRLKQLGIIPQDAATHPRLDAVPGWDSLTEEEKQVQTRNMEIYAAMVDYLDDQIGRLLDHLKDIGAYDNTLIVFMSDNGMEGTDPHNLFPLFGATPELVAEYNAGTDNSPENKGRQGSYVTINEGWAQAGVGIHRDFKGFSAEGGIRVPMMVKHPDMVGAGTLNDGFCSAMDIAPTFLEVADAELPVQPFRGASLVPVLEGAQAMVHDADYEFLADIFGRQSYQQNDYKLLRRSPADAWELFDLVTDQGETTDLSGDATYSSLYQDLQDNFDRYAAEIGMVY